MLLYGGDELSLKLFSSFTAGAAVQVFIRCGTVIWYRRFR